MLRYVLMFLFVGLMAGTLNRAGVGVVATQSS
jgi:uncharacterized membrane protein YtjA (UPF0391 family)